MAEKTADEVAAIFSAAGDSVTVINGDKATDQIDAEWKGDVSLGPLEREVLTVYVEHPRVKDLVAFDEERIIEFLSKKANVQLVKIKPVIYIDNI